MDMSPDASLSDRPTPSTSNSYPDTSSRTSYTSPDECYVNRHSSIGSAVGLADGGPTPDSDAMSMPPLCHTSTNSTANTNLLTTTTSGSASVVAAPAPAPSASTSAAAASFFQDTTDDDFASFAAFYHPLSEGQISVDEMVQSTENAGFAAASWGMSAPVTVGGRLGAARVDQSGTWQTFDNLEWAPSGT